MKRLVVGLLVFAALGVVLPAAKADSLAIWISTVNNPPLSGDQVASAASGTSVSYSNTNFNGFAIDMVATSSNSPGQTTIAKLTGANLSITNNNSTTATIYISLGDGDFTKPTAPGDLKMKSHIGTTTVVDSLANKLTFQSYVNPDNSQNGTTGFTTGPQNPSIVTGSSSNDAFKTITSLSGSYSITETFAITLGAGSEINFSTNTTLTPVPEPASLTLAAMSAIGLVGYGLRRRKVVNAIAC
jgi:hypothetical protein